MSAVTGVDLGTRAVKVATDGGAVQTLVAPAGGPAGSLRAALSAVGGQGVICIAVPDAWLSGTVAGATAQEAVRHECAGELKCAQVLWAGQLAATAAYAAAAHGAGRYLVCDLGWSGTRAGMFRAAGGTVLVEATHAEADGGWRTFDAEVRAGLPQSPRCPLPGMSRSPTAARPGRPPRSRAPSAGSGASAPPRSTASLGPTATSSSRRAG